TKPGSPGPAPTSVTWPTPAVLFSAAGAGSGRRSAAARTTTSYDDSSGGVDVQVSRPRFARSSTAAHTTGAAIVTSAPSRSSALTVATAASLPSSTSTDRPVTFSST